MTRKIRFGVVGCGGIAKRFINALRMSDCAELYAVASQTEGRAEAYAKEFAAPKAYDDYEKLIHDPQVDAIYIALVHTMHYPVIMKCIEAGKPILCEKPMLIHEAEAKIVAEEARKRNVLVMEAFWTRTLPCYRKTKQWIEDGRIGRLSMISADFCFRFPYNEETKNFRLWDHKVGGGALLDAGVYPYLFITGIAGRHPKDVQGFLQMNTELMVDTSVTMELLFENGVLGIGSASLISEKSQTATVSGTNGYILVHDFLGSRMVELYDEKDHLVESYSDPQPEGFVHEIRHFVQLYLEQKTESPLIPLADSVDFAAAAEKIYQQNGYAYTECSCQEK